MINIDKRINVIKKKLNNLNKLIELHEEYIKEYEDDPDLENLKQRKLEVINELKQIQDIRDNKSMKNRTMESYYKYDCEYDRLTIRAKDEYNYENTLELGNGILLDFNINNIPVALDIFDASKLFNVTKLSLKNIKDINMNIIISKEKINVNLKIDMNIHNKLTHKFINESVINNINAPAINTELLAV
jgi:uncharacterized protein YuzE